MSEAFKICPICDTANHRNAAACVTCGTSLATVSAAAASGRAEANAILYDYRFGETDLLEDSLRFKAQRYLAMLVFALIVLMAGGLALIFAPQIRQVTQSVGTRVQSIAFITNTPRPLVALPTVTLGPPTLTASATPLPSATFTDTPTLAPCQQEVQPEDGLYAIVLRCGHQDLFVLTEVIRLNDLDSDTDISPGQIIDVPWPTATLDPNASPTGEPTSLDSQSTDEASAGEDTTISFNATLLADPFYRPTPELPPGVMFHIVQPDDNGIIISELYETNVEVLSQLNPEMTFSQCDFGEPYGGPRCIIPLAVGQSVRVPAPTPTPTLSPTPSGSETATPSPTPVFNAPSSISPSNRAFFRKDQIVTLRWVTSGVLDDGEVYRVIITRTEDDQTFMANRQEPFLVVPAEWQGGTAERYEYSWTVSIVNLDNPQRLNYTTQPLTFTWEGRGEEN